MKIIKIDWLDEDSKEGELTISDGNFTCTAFSHPCKYVEGNFLKEPIHAFEPENLMIALDDTISIDPTEDPFTYKIHGRVIDDYRISVGDLIIKLGYVLPGWAKKGDYVEFTSYLVVI